MIVERTSGREDDIDIENLREEDLIYVGDADDILNAMEDELLSDTPEEDPEFDPPRNDAQVVLVHPAHKSTFCVAIHPNQHIYAVGTEADKLFVWGKDETVKATIDFTDSVIVTEFSPDGTFLAAADMAGNVRVLNVTSEPYETAFEYAVGDLMFLFWHKKANILFAGSECGNIYVFKIPSGDCKILPSHGKRVNAAVMLHDGMRIAAGYDDGAVRIWDVRSCVPQQQTKADSGVLSIDSHFENNLIIVGTDQGTMSLINTSSGKILNSLNVGNDSIECVTFYNNPEYNVAAIACLDGSILIWDVNRSTVRHKIAVDAGISVLKWLDDAKLLAGHLDAVTRLYDTKSGETLRDYMGHKRAVLDLAVTSDNKWFLSSSDDSTAMLFEVDKEVQVSDL